MVYLAWKLMSGRNVMVCETRLAGLLSKRLGCAHVRLEKMSGPDAPSAVFSGVAGGGARCLVKVVPRGGAARSVLAMRACRELSFVPHLLVDEVMDLDDCDVICTDFLEGQPVQEIEQLSDVRFRKLLEGYERLSHALARLRGQFESARRGLPARLYGIASKFAQDRLPWRFALRDILKLPVSAYEYGDRVLGIVHNDFHAGNFAFVGDSLAAIWDLENLDEGLPCEDIVYALCSRYRSGSVSRAGRRRLNTMLAMAAARLPFPRGDWSLAFRLFRLSHAVIEIMRYGQKRNAWPAAVRIFQRDRRLSELARTVGAAIPPVHDASRE